MLNPGFEKEYRETYSLTFNIVSGRSSDGKLIDMRVLLHTKAKNNEEISKIGSHFVVILRNGSINFSGN